MLQANWLFSPGRSALVLTTMFFGSVSPHKVTAGRERRPHSHPLTTVRWERTTTLTYTTTCACLPWEHLATSLCQQQQKQRVSSTQTMPVHHLRRFYRTYVTEPPYKQRSQESLNRTYYNIRDLLFLLRWSSGIKVVMDTKGLLRWTISLSQGSAYLTLKTATCQTLYLHPAQ